MKKFKILGFILLLIMLSISCEELPDPAGERGVGVVPDISNLNPGIFDSKSLSTTYVEFTVNLAAGATAEKVTVVGSYNDNNEESAITEITTFPSVVRILASDAAQKMGVALGDIANGDIFTFQLLPTVSSKTYHSAAVLSIAVACAYDVNLATGSYHVIGGEWQSEGDVTLTSDPDDPYKIYVVGLEEIEGAVEDEGPLVMYINPADYSVEVPEIVICSDFFGYGPISYKGDGVYNSCTGAFNMNFDISVGDYGSQGVFIFTFTRN